MTSAQPRDDPVHARLPASQTGLPADTVFLCFQIRSLDPSRFRTPAGELKPAGRVPDDRMQDVDEALRRVLGL